MVQAIAAAVADPERQLRSLTVHYLRPPLEGDVRVDVEVQRSGRSLSTVTARLSQAGTLCVLAVAAFAIELDGALDYAAQSRPPRARPRRSSASRPSPRCRSPRTS